MPGGAGLPVLGIVGGSGLLQGAAASGDRAAPAASSGAHGAAGAGDGAVRSLIASLGEKRVVHTPHGAVRVSRGTVGTTSGELRVVFVQRHGADPAAAYTQPAEVNYAAIAAALASEGCHAVVGVASVGALSHRNPLGSLLVPDDFFCPWDIRTGTPTKRAHVMPGYHKGARSALLRSLTGSSAAAVRSAKDGGIYVNSRGPRFETPAEIRFMAAHGDVVGMTGAHEATAFGEERVPYACVAVVDNLANGVEATAGGASDGGLSLEKFYAAQRDNHTMVLQAIEAIVEGFSADVDALRAMRPLSSGSGGAGGGDKEPCALLVRARYVVPVAADDASVAAGGHETVLEDHSVAVDGDGKIIAVLPAAEAAARFEAAEERHLAEHVLMPGLVNAHTHTSMVLFRGVADDKPLLEWLTQSVWPAEGKTVGETGFVADGARHGFAEMIRGGTTCANDMYFSEGEVARVACEVGFRVAISHIVLDFPTPYASGPDEYFAKAREVHAAWADKPLISVTVAPHAPYTVCDDNLVRVKELAEELGCPIHIHLHETADECAHSLAGVEGSMSRHRSEQLCRPFANLDRLGLVSPRLIAAHGVHLNGEEITRLAAAGGSVVHCPASNMKLASGFAPVDALLKAGVNVAIGTDGAASNNALDMLGELRLAALMAKAVTGDATAVPASMAVRMGTLNGARALGLQDSIGSLEAGKWADMIALRVTEPEITPVYDVLSHIVYVLGRENVSDVWIAGKRVLADRRLTTINLDEVKAAADKWRPVVLSAIAPADDDGAAKK